MVGWVAEVAEAAGVEAQVVAEGLAREVGK